METTKTEKYINKLPYSTIMKKEVFSWECPECGKEIESLHQGQFEHNKGLHINSHKKRS